MKVHDNTAFTGGLVVSRTTVNLFKAKGFVQPLSCNIGLPHFEENPPPDTSEKGLEQRSGDTLPTTGGRDRKVQDFPFIRRGTPRDEKPHDLSVEVRDRDIISSRVPSGRLGAVALNGRDGGAVVFASGSDDHYFLGA